MTTFSIQEKVDIIIDFFGLAPQSAKYLTGAIKKYGIHLNHAKIVINVLHTAIIVNSTNNKRNLLFIEGKLLGVDEERENFLRYLRINIERRDDEFLVMESGISGLKFRAIRRTEGLNPLLNVRDKFGENHTIRIKMSIDEIIEKILALDPTPEVRARIDEYIDAHLPSQAFRAIVDDYANSEQLEVQEALDRLIMDGNSVALALRHILNEDELRKSRRTRR